MIRGDPKSAPPWSLKPQGCLSNLDNFTSTVVIFNTATHCHGVICNLIHLLLTISSVIVESGSMCDYYEEIGNTDTSAVQCSAVQCSVSVETADRLRD